MNSFLVTRGPTDLCLSADEDAAVRVIRCDDNATELDREKEARTGIAVTFLVPARPHRGEALLRLCAVLLLPSTVPWELRRRRRVIVK